MRTVRIAAAAVVALLAGPAHALDGGEPEPSYTWGQVADGARALGELLLRGPVPIPGRKPPPPTLVTGKPQPPAGAGAVEYVVVDGRAHPTIGSASPFEFPLSTGVDESGRRGFIARALSPTRADKVWRGWAARVAALKSDPTAMLREADKIIDTAFRYVDYPGYDWRSPLAARDQGGVCREFAVAKFALLRDAGFTPADMRIMTLTPNIPGQNYHVVLAARVGEQEYILDMTRTDRAQGDGVAIPRAQFQIGRGMVWAGTPSGHVNFPVTIDGMDDAVRAIRPPVASTVREATDQVTEASIPQAAEDFRRSAPSGSITAVIRAPGDFPRYRLAR